MSSWRYPSCDDHRRHQEDAERDARYHSHAHQPSSWDEPDCRRAYDDAYRQEESRQQRLAEEAAEERRQERMAEEHRQEAMREQEQEDEYYHQQQEQGEPEPIQPPSESSPSLNTSTKAP